MRRFVIFFFIGILSIASVFLFAQSRHTDAVVTDWTQALIPSQSGSVKGAKNIEPTTPMQPSPIKILIDKNPVQLYWPQKITIETNPGTEVRVVTTYPNGSLNNSGTKSGYADKKGKFIVGWSIKGTKDLLGTASVNVSVGSLETYAETRTTFDIVKSLKDLSNQPVIQTGSKPSQL